MSSEVAGRLASVRERIAAACRRAGRSESAVTLVAVSKGQPLEAVLAAADAGQRVFAENYAQELVDKSMASAGRDVMWHFVGGLQRNKIRKLVGLVDLIASLDDAAAAIEIDRRAAAIGRAQDALVQVNLDDEEQKSGVTPAELPSLLEVIAPLVHLRCRGLMAIPRPKDDLDETRAAFRELAGLARQHRLDAISMGMSSDFEAAIEEGATMVRVGTAIFGPRRRKTGAEPSGKPPENG